MKLLETEKQYRDAERNREAGATSNAERYRGENNWGQLYFLSKTDISTLSTDHLKRHLAARNISFEGSKKKLISRLVNSVEEENQKEITIALELAHIHIRDLEQKGSVYVAGKNDQGQLGLGDLDDRRIFTVIPTFRGKDVCHLSAYGAICIATTNESEVYVWGGNGVNPVALEDKKEFNLPRRMTMLDGEETVLTATGRSHACSISKAGDLFVWGKLGVEDTRLTPQYVDNFTAVSVACGAKHVSVITDEGELYAWGSTSSGRVGVGNIKQSFQATPMLVKFSEHIKLISCGSDHTIAATKSRIFSWGSNDGYRLGLGDCSGRDSPCEITTIAALGGCQILDISAGVFHSACVIRKELLTTESEIYTWGSGYCGQLALGEQCIATTPTKVEELSGVKRISCGRTHNAAITHDNNLYTWGSNEHGQLGRSIEEADVRFTPFPGVVEFGTIVNQVGRGQPKLVACGHDFTVVTTHPFDGPSEEEMIKLLETKHRKEQEEKEEQEILLKAQEQEATKQWKIEAEKKKIRYLTSKRLCTMEPNCPGFTYESTKPSICRECGYSVAFHTIVADEGDREISPL
jgi:alpha-tubulin suppressor-like RCC1 family protein